MDVGRTKLNLARAVLAKDLTAVAKANGGQISVDAASDRFGTSSEAERLALRDVVAEAVKKAGGAANTKGAKDTLEGLVDRAKGYAKSGHIRQVEDLPAEIRGLVRLADELPGSTVAAPSPAPAGTSNDAIVDRWNAKVDPDAAGQPLPTNWRVKRSALPDESDASRRALALADEDGLKPLEVYRNPEDASFALYSQTDGESDARIWIADAKGHELALIDVGEDGTVSISASEPIVPPAKPTGPAESLAGDAAFIATLKSTLDTTLIDQTLMNANYLEVPRSKNSRVDNPESWLLPAQLKKLYRDKNEDPHVLKFPLDGHMTYLVYETTGWQRGANQELYANHAITAFDRAGSVLAAGTRRKESGEGSNNSTELKKPFNWA